VSSFSDANALFRAGRFDEALPLFEFLCQKNPDFSPYRSGLQSTLKKLKKTDLEINEYMSEICVSEANRKYSEAIHPESKFTTDESLINFVVVTPVHNGEEFLDQTIESVLSQKGNFSIEYFVKDGCSTDNTVPKLEKWCERIRHGDIPLNCRGVRFRYESSKDNGIYDAVAYAFGKASATKRDILTYINADDYFTETAFGIADTVFTKIPQARWICGQIHVVDTQNQTLKTPRFPLTYARKDIQNGLHDGRTLYFIQQEGVFWTRGLYEQVGGINRNLKLAGDFDLWQRFAAHSELLPVSCNLAVFRSRPGQLSNQINEYYLEVDRLNNQHASSEYEVSEYLFSGVGNASMGNIPPKLGRLQTPGPICFLTEDGHIKEVAYVQRAWLDW